ncbi:hypothetical protein X772_11300 [Mesorhizobium sp. LSJC280B00]|nr:hypothetical protein X772_11300 [Mesorhizobium sp. LSJC280B00]
MHAKHDLSAELAYEIDCFARRCGLTRDEALKMMRNAGRSNDGTKASGEPGPKWPHGFYIAGGRTVIRHSCFVVCLGIRMAVGGGAHR